MAELLGGALLVVFSLLLWRSARRARIRRSRRFEQREDLSLAEFWQRFYKDAGVPQDIVEEILSLVAQAAEIPVAKLRPSDRFAQELAPEAGWEFDDGLTEIRWFVEAKARKLGMPLDLSSVLTVDDLIRLTHGLRPL